MYSLGSRNLKYYKDINAVTITDKVWMEKDKRLNKQKTPPGDVNSTKQND